MILVINNKVLSGMESIQAKKKQYKLDNKDAIKEYSKQSILITKLPF